jgi:Ca-activated chloride channel family protein
MMTGFDPGDPGVLLALRTDYELGDPWFLLLLLLIPGVFLVQKLKSLRAPSRYPTANILKTLPRTWRLRGLTLLPWVRALALAGLVLGLARPLRGLAESRMYAEGVDIALVIDRSPSMLTDDMAEEKTRFQVAQEVLKEFIAGRPADRLALLSFARYPSVDCPLTLDHDAVTRFLSDLKPARPRSPEDGTAIGVALAHAAHRLKESQAKNKVAILLTDGQNNIHDIEPEDGAKLLKQYGIKVYGVAVGQGLVQNIFGRRFVGPFDTSELERVVEITGGRVFKAEDEEKLRNVYQKIDELEKTKLEDVTSFAQYIDLYPYVVIPALVLLGLEVLLKRTVLLRIP